MIDNIIETKDLTKNFGYTTALNSVSIEVKGSYSGSNGRITGLIGVNGAGKTTLMRTLLGIIKPTSGSAKVFGYDIKRESNKIRKIVGYMMEGDTYIPSVNAKKYLAHMAELSGLPRKESLQRAHDVLTFSGLGSDRYRDVDTYSKGMRQKLKLAAALVHSPDILFLDEPTDGLDPAAREKMLKMIKTLTKETGTNVFLSTHILHDIEKIADDVIILDQGEVLLKSSLSEITQQYENVKQIFIPGKEAGEILLQELEQNQDINIEIEKFLFEERLGRTVIEVNITSEEERIKLMDILKYKEIQISGYSSKKPDLQNIVIELFKGKKNENIEGNY